MRTKLARTLLVLGVGLPACERADGLSRPLIDRQARPAVGNIGQTGRPPAQPPVTPANRPLVARDATPAVGNIGQTGRPSVSLRERRVQPTARPDVRVPDAAIARQPRANAARADQPEVARVPQPRANVAAAMRDAHVGDAVLGQAGWPSPPAPRDPRISVEPRDAIAEQARPLVDRRNRPAAGNVMRKGGWKDDDRELGFSTEPRQIALEPLVTRTERPATGNVMGKARRRPRMTDRLEHYRGEVARWQRELADADTVERRAYCRMREHAAARAVEEERKRLEAAAP